MKQGSITSFMKKKGTESEVSNNTALLNSNSSSKSSIQRTNLSQNENSKEILSSAKSRLDTNKKQDNLNLNNSSKKRRHIIDEDEEDIVNVESFAEDLLIGGKESKVEKGKNY